MIMLKDILTIKNPADYKIHFARWDHSDQPLDVWVRNRQEWQGWQEYRPQRDEFNRPYIFSLMRFYHESEAWLFGGVFEVTSRLSDQYQVQISDRWKEYIGRLKVSSSYNGRPSRLNFENHYPEISVREVLAEPYSGRSFPGYEDVSISFGELESIVRNGRPDWKAALESIKGIYLITDANTGRRYIGAAYGDQGIWARWCAYVADGHGGNVELRRLVNDPSLSYCRANFRFALLEHRAMRISDEKILARETFWKDILLTRGELNRN